MEVSSEERLFRICVQRGTEKWGRGWEHLSDKQKRDTVISEVFYTLCAQDESVAGDVIIRIVHHAQSRLVDLFPGA